jgi:hypothetical protein
MEPWQERVVEEKRELDGRIERLSAFLEGPAESGNLRDAVDASLLVSQLEVMRDYSRLLGMRIRRFDRPCG